MFSDFKKGKHIVILHHTVRPMKCLYRVLEALEEATEERPFLVEVVVQGPSKDVPSLDEVLSDATIEVVKQDHERILGTPLQQRNRAYYAKSKLKKNPVRNLGRR
jgi:hypothetical protein